MLRRSGKLGIDSSHAESESVNWVTPLAIYAERVAIHT